MTDSHPLIWLALLGATVAAALRFTHPLMLASFVVALLLTGFLVRGPRVASFGFACVGALAAALVWAGWTLLVPTGSGDVVFSLPEHTFGPGVRLGGAVTTDSLERGITNALAASAVVLAIGVAGQLVSARGWLSLARLTGPLAPAFGWLASCGEACAEVASSRRQARGRHLRPSLDVWLGATRDVARDLPGVTPKLLLRPHRADLWQGLAAVAWVAAVVFAPRIGVVGVAVAALLLPVAVALGTPRREAAHA
ncbi:hypothetical protein [uncultured Tessaracoccus sp.]|uniref:hypothetical protein n=1 Tax=uncultured Tessaracoccus sp. TaxID=905023 RepID=UPI002605C919|nr:hypothetical protein [uncultured Tessaracoccus sp.]